MNLTFVIVLATILVSLFVISQAVIIYLLKKENGELMEMLAEAKPPF